MYVYLLGLPGPVLRGAFGILFRICRKFYRVRHYIRAYYVSRVSVLAVKVVRYHDQRLELPEHFYRELPEIIHVIAVVVEGAEYVLHCFRLGLSIRISVRKFGHVRIIGNSYGPEPVELFVLPEMLEDAHLLMEMLYEIDYLDVQLLFVDVVGEQPREEQLLVVRMRGDQKQVRFLQHGLPFLHPRRRLA